MKKKVRVYDAAYTKPGSRMMYKTFSGDKATVEHIRQARPPRKGYSLMQIVNDATQKVVWQR